MKRLLRETGLGPELDRYVWQMKKNQPSSTASGAPGATPDKKSRKVKRAEKWLNKQEKKGRLELTAVTNEAGDVTGYETKKLRKSAKRKARKHTANLKAAAGDAATTTQQKLDAIAAGTVNVGFRARKEKNMERKGKKEAVKLHGKEQQRQVEAEYKQQLDQGVDKQTAKDSYEAALQMVESEMAAAKKLLKKSVYLSNEQAGKSELLQRLTGETVREYFPKANRVSRMGGDVAAALDEADQANTSARQRAHTKAAPDASTAAILEREFELQETPYENENYAELIAAAQAPTAQNLEALTATDVSTAKLKEFTEHFDAIAKQFADKRADHQSDGLYHQHLTTMTDQFEAVNQRANDVVHHHDSLLGALVRDPIFRLQGGPSQAQPSSVFTDLLEEGDFSDTRAKYTEYEALVMDLHDRLYSDEAGMVILQADDDREAWRRAVKMVGEIKQLILEDTAQAVQATLAELQSLPLALSVAEYNGDMTEYIRLMNRTAAIVPGVEEIDPSSVDVEQLNKNLEILYQNSFLKLGVYDNLMELFDQTRFAGFTPERTSWSEITAKHTMDSNAQKAVQEWYDTQLESRVEQLWRDLKQVGNSTGDRSRPLRAAVDPQTLEVKNQTKYDELSSRVRAHLEGMRVRLAEVKGDLLEAVDRTLSNEAMLSDEGVLAAEAISQMEAQLRQPTGRGLSLEPYDDGSGDYSARYNKLLNDLDPASRLLVETQFDARIQAGDTPDDVYRLLVEAATYYQRYAASQSITERMKADGYDPTAEHQPLSDVARESLGREALKGSQIWQLKEQLMDQQSELAVKLGELNVAKENLMVAKTNLREERDALARAEKTSEAHDLDEKTEGIVETARKDVETAKIDHKQAEQQQAAAKEAYDQLAEKMTTLQEQLTEAIAKKQAELQAELEKTQTDKQAADRRVVGQQQLIEDWLHDHIDAGVNSEYFELVRDALLNDNTELNLDLVEGGFVVDMDAIKPELEQFYAYRAERDTLQQKIDLINGQAAVLDLTLTDIDPVPDSEVVVDKDDDESDDEKPDEQNNDEDKNENGIELSPEAKMRANLKILGEALAITDMNMVTPELEFGTYHSRSDRNTPLGFSLKYIDQDGNLQMKTISEYVKSLADFDANQLQTFIDDFNDLHSDASLKELSTADYATQLNEFLSEDNQQEVSENEPTSETETVEVEEMDEKTEAQLELLLGLRGNPEALQKLEALIKLDDPCDPTTAEFRYFSALVDGVPRSQTLLNKINELLGKIAGDECPCTDQAKERLQLYAEALDKMICFLDQIPKEDEPKPDNDSDRGSDDDNSGNGSDGNGGGNNGDGGGDGTNGDGSGDGGADSMNCDCENWPDWMAKIAGVDERAMSIAGGVANNDLIVKAILNPAQGITFPQAITDLANQHQYARVAGTTMSGRAIAAGGAFTNALQGFLNGNLSNPSPNLAQDGLMGPGTISAFERYLQMNAPLASPTGTGNPVVDRNSGSGGNTEPIKVDNTKTALVNSREKVVNSALSPTVSSGYIDTTLETTAGRNVIPVAADAKEVKYAGINMYIKEVTAPTPLTIAMLGNDYYLPVVDDKITLPEGVKITPDENGSANIALMPGYMAASDAGTTSLSGMTLSELKTAPNPTESVQMSWDGASALTGLGEGVEKVYLPGGKTTDVVQDESDRYLVFAEVNGNRFGVKINNESVTLPAGVTWQTNGQFEDANGKNMTVNGAPTNMGGTLFFTELKSPEVTSVVKTISVDSCDLNAGTPRTIGADITTVEFSDDADLMATVETVNGKRYFVLGNDRVAIGTDNKLILPEGVVIDIGYKNFTANDGDKVLETQEVGDINVITGVKEEGTRPVDNVEVSDTTQEFDPEHPEKGGWIAYSTWASLNIIIEGETAPIGYDIGWGSSKYFIQFKQNGVRNRIELESERRSGVNYVKIPPNLKIETVNGETSFILRDGYQINNNDIYDQSPKSA